MTDGGNADYGSEMQPDGGRTGPSTDGTEHKYEVGDKFHGLPEWTYEVTNRMVDVDTNDPLYRLNGYGRLAGNETKVLTESSLESNFEQFEGSQSSTDTDQEGQR